MVTNPPMTLDKVLELLQANGLIVPTAGDQYIIRARWFNHPWLDKRNGPCEPGDLVYIRSVDMSQHTCTAILNTGSDAFTADELSFTDLMIFTKKLELD